MNESSLLIVALVALIAAVVACSAAPATTEEEWNSNQAEVFDNKELVANKKSYDPKETLKLLELASEVLAGLTDETSVKHKQEAEELIEVSKLDKSKCDQLNKFDQLKEQHKDEGANIGPYLDFFKAEQSKLC